jgi:hypothetical protein
MAFDDPDDTTHDDVDPMGGADAPGTTSVAIQNFLVDNFWLIVAVLAFVGFIYSVYQH